MTDLPHSFTFYLQLSSVPSHTCRMERLHSIIRGKIYYFASNSAGTNPTLRPNGCFPAHFSKNSMFPLDDEGEELERAETET